MTYKVIILIAILLTSITSINALIIGQKAQSICQRSSSDPEQYLIEVGNPYDCTKYYTCQPGPQGFIARLMQCPAGTSFMPKFLKGSCNGANPKDLKDCFKGEWTTWSSWSTCSKSCGQGLKSRNRDCKGPWHPNYLKYKCRGAKDESQSCSVQDCTGQWSSTWSNWSACNATCGQASRHRSRQCLEGQNCIGESNEFENCDMPNCIGTWSDWSEWSTCSRTCKDDNHTPKRIRARECHGGVDFVCHGSRLQIRDCENCQRCYQTSGNDSNLDCTF